MMHIAQPHGSQAKEWGWWTVRETKRRPRRGMGMGGAEVNKTRQDKTIQGEKLKCSKTARCCIPAAFRL